MPYKSKNIDLDEGDLETGTRVCTDCTKRKPMSEFFWYNSPKKKKAGRRAKCKKCVQEIAKGYREGNRDRYRRNSLKWHLNATYGVTLEFYDNMLLKQNGVCAICSIVFDMADQNRRPHVDHDHKTGAIRGILCFSCNTGIGKLRDDVVLLQSAINYLNREIQ